MSVCEMKTTGFDHVADYTLTDGGKVCTRRTVTDEDLLEFWFCFCTVVTSLYR